MLLELTGRRPARNEWAALRDAAASSSSRGGSFVRELTDRGDREYFVRRWIIARLQPVAKGGAKLAHASGAGATNG